MLARRTAIVIAMLTGLVAAPPSAHDYQLASIKIDHPWSRATPKGAPVAGGYVTIKNTGAETDRLVSVTSALSERVELHHSTITDGIARMAPVSGGIDLAPGDTVELKSGGTHIMFMKPSRTLKPGEKFAAQLVLEKAGTVEVEFAVQGMGSRESEPEPDPHHGATSQ